MLKKLNKTFKNFQTVLNNKTGQVAIILIMIIAATLIFYAVSFNFGRLSQNKLLVTMASNIGASQLASVMASYGQNVYQTQLGGHTKVCGWTGVAKALMAVAAILIILIVIVVFIVLCVLGVFTGGATIAVALALYNAVGPLLVALAVAIAAAGIQAAVVEPAISKAWGKFAAKTLSMEGQFLERAIGESLQKAVTDHAFVPDLFDSDQDMLWGFDAMNEPVDEIGRFGVFYNERIKTIKAPSKLVIKKFLEELEEFVYEGLDGWGLYDPVGCAEGCCYDHDTNPNVPSVCNPCCVPTTFEIPSGDNFSGEEIQDYELRSSACDCTSSTPACQNDSEIGTANSCDARSPYVGGTYMYSYIYDEFYENHENNNEGDPNSFISFREAMGTDDENIYYYKNRVDPNGVQIPDSTNDFRIGDTDGYYNYLDFYAFKTCLDNCSEANCGLDTDGGPLSSDAKYNYPDPSITFTCAGWGTVANEWYTDIKTNFAMVSTASIPLDYDSLTACLNDCNSANCNNTLPGGGYPPDDELDCRLPSENPPGTWGTKANPWFKAVLDNRDSIVFSPVTVDMKTGIFDFFYKLQEGGIGLNDLDAVEHVDHCHWTDPTYNPPPAECLNTNISDYLRIRPLRLPKDTADNFFNKTDIVDGSNTGPDTARVPLAVDKVRIPDFGVDNFGFFGDGYCATSAFLKARDNSFYDPSVPADWVGMWKKGSERFCSEGDLDPPPDGTTDWPYFYNCGHGVCSTTFSDGETLESPCVCEEKANPSDLLGGIIDSDIPPFHDDAFDYLVYEIPAFLSWAKGLLDTPEDLLYTTFKQWYVDAAEWIESGVNSDPYGSCAVDDVSASPLGSCTTYPSTMVPAYCAMCNEEDGGLHRFLKTIRGIILRLEKFRDFSFMAEDNTEGDTECNEVWCVPDVRVGSSCLASASPDPGLVWPDEEGAIIGASSTSDSDLKSVIGCLNHNLNNEEGLNNYERFLRCEAAATNAWVAINNLVAMGEGHAINDPSDMDDAMELVQQAYDFCPNPSGGRYLPRSMVYPDSSNVPFDPTGEFVPPDIATLDAYLRCHNICKGYNTDCQTDYGECSILCEEIDDSTPEGTLARSQCFEDCSEEYDGCMDNLTHVCPGTTIQCRDDDRYVVMTEEIETALGSISDADPNSRSGYMELLYKSRIDAENQMEKFRRRRDYLQEIEDKLEKMITIFTEAEQRFRDFLICDPDNDPNTEDDGPACKLIKERMKDLENSDLPFEVVYGWQGEPVANRPGLKADQGYWHIVKVEGRIPLKCDNRCGPNPDGSGGERWPFVRTYTKRHIKRCYELSAREGRVKMRVTRYDEDRDRDRILVFPNGMPIWDFKFRNPTTEVLHPDATSGLLECINAAGRPLGAPDISGFTLPSGVVDIYKGAFMINKEDESVQCWAAANSLLRRGVKSETCARYYFSGGSFSPGFNFKFYNCKDSGF